MVQNLWIPQRFSKRFPEISKVPQKVPRELFLRVSQKLSELLFSVKKQRIRRKPRPWNYTEFKLFPVHLYDSFQFNRKGIRTQICKQQKSRVQREKKNLSQQKASGSRRLEKAQRDARKWKGDALKCQGELNALTKYSPKFRGETCKCLHIHILTFEF